ncbi:MAG: hypothetical protein SchgKO_13240 [Schleiferiaceae bacterium]
MRKIIFLSLLSLGFLAACDKEDDDDNGGGSTTTNRYSEALFDSVDVTTVTYSDTFALDMDIYQPVGDNANNRRVIVLAHGGSFYSGTKENPTIVYLAEEFAKMGYVSVSIDYRKEGSIANLLDSTNAVGAVSRAVNDGKAAIRYLRKSAASGNPFGIDESKIIVGGNSAGGVLALHLAYLDDQSNLPAHVDSIIQVEGGFEGMSGNPGYSSDVSAIWSLAGGIHRDYWIYNKGKTIVNAHGDMDGIVPFGCDDIYRGFYPQFELVQLCGSEAVQAQADNAGETSYTLVFPGADHVPWWEYDPAGGPGMPNADMASVLEFSIPKLKEALD